MLSGFENETATFYVEEQVDTEEGPYNETQPITEWVPKYEDVQVRAEQADSEYVREVYSEWPMEVYRLFVDPYKIGTVGPTEDETRGGFGESFGSHFGGLVIEGLERGEYELGIESGDRVEIAGVTDARFEIQPPNLQRLDSQIPEMVQLEVVKVGV